MGVFRWFRLRESQREALAVAALCAGWYSASAASSVVGKLVLAEFPFPVTVTMVQLLSVAACSPAALALAGVRRAPAFPRRYYWRTLGPLALAKFLTTVCSQVSLWKVPISYAHTVKATTPLWTALLARVLLGERVGGGVAGALLLVAAGVGVASATELHFDALGLFAALAAAALLSLQHLYSKRVMRDTGVHHLRLLQTLGWLALVLFLPVWAWADGARVWAARARLAASGWRLAADGLLAWLQAVLAFSVLSRVAPLTYAVASAAKRAAVVGASLLLLRNPAPPANVAGMALAAAGVLLYHRAKHRRPAPPTALPV